jgi:uncharacterized protein (DUF2252 family)
MARFAQAYVRGNTAQFYEAVQAAAPGYNHKKIPKNHAERVVGGARAPFPGERMLAATLQRKPVVSD